MTRFRFFLTEALELQRRDRTGGMASFTALTAVLFLLSLVFFAGLNIRGAARTLEARKGIEVFLADDCPPERVEELARAFRSFGEVADISFVSQEAALRTIEQELGGVDIVGMMGENPLAPSIQLTLTPQAAAREGVVADLAREIGAYEGVEEVLYGSSWVEALERGLRYVYWTTAGAGALAALAVIVVLWNTIHLAFLGRRETIRILKVVGASPSFIRSPYILLGGMHAFLAAACAVTLTGIVHLALATMMPGLQFFPSEWILAYLAGAVALGALSSFASVEPALRGLEKSHEAVVR